LFVSSFGLREGYLHERVLKEDAACAGGE
jgi:hypothetical protein